MANANTPSASATPLHKPNTAAATLVTRRTRCVDDTIAGDSWSTRSVIPHAPNDRRQTPAASSGNHAGGLNTTATSAATTPIPAAETSRPSGVRRASCAKTVPRFSSVECMAASFALRDQEAP